MLFLLLVLHAGLSFMSSKLNPGLWMFKDKSTHFIFDGMIGFIHSFRHPIFFIISGFVTYQMSQKYSWNKLIIKRFKRLFIPMLIIIFLAGPFIHILISQLMGKIDTFSLQVIYPSSSEYSFGFSTIYVWFLYYLMLFTLIHLIIERLGIMSYFSRIKLGKNWFLTSIVILTIIIICTLAFWGENSLFGDYHWNPNLLSFGGFLSFYLFGIFLANQKEALTNIKNHGLFFVILGTVSFIIYSVQGLNELNQVGNAMKFNWIIMISSGLSSVFFAIGFMGLALKYYTQSNKYISYISRSSYFLYLIHFPILILFLKYCVQYDWNAFIKFLFVLIATCLCSFIINVLWVKLWKNNPPI